MNEAFLTAIEHEVASWPGISTEPGRFHSISFRLGRQEIGHLHRNGVADIPFPRVVHDELIASGRARPHQAGSPTIISFSIQQPDDVAEAINLFRMSADEEQGSRTMTTQQDGDSPDWSAIHAQVIVEFRRNGGRVRQEFGGDSLLILETVGARTGQPRLAPLGYIREGDRYFIINGTAAYGAIRNPGWYYNLRANPRAMIEVGRERFPVIARELTGDEWQALWSRFQARAPWTADFTAKEPHQTFQIFELTRAA